MPGYVIRPLLEAGEFSGGQGADPPQRRLRLGQVMLTAMVSKKVLGSSAFPIADQALVSAANFLTMIIVARALGLDGFGIFSLAWLVVLFFASIQYALISAPMMSIAPKQDAVFESAYFGALFLQQTVMAAATFLMAWIGVAATSALAPQWEIANLALPLAFAAAGYQVQDFLRRYFFVLGRARAAVGIDTISYGGQVALIAWLFTTGGLSLEIALWAIAATSVASAVVGAFLVEPLTWRRRAIVDISVRHWRFARWLVAVAVLQLSSGYLFIFATGAMLGPAAVGALRAAQNLMGAVHVITKGLENIVPTTASRRYHHQGVAGLLSYVRNVALAGGVATALIAIMIGAFPEFWLGLVFGEEYVGFEGLVRWFAVIIVLDFFQVPLQGGLRALERTMPIFMAAATSTVVALVSAYPLILAFGATGSAMGILIVFIVSNAVLVLGLARRRHGVAVGRPVEASAEI